MAINMANCNEQKNPLQHNGTSRAERMLAALQQDYIKVDEKSFAQWIVFAQEFSKYINYYELNGEAAGNWTPFFSSDVSAVLGSLAIQDVEEYKRQIKSRFDFLKDDDSKTKVPGMKIKLNDLFSAIVSFCVSLDRYYRLVPADTTLKSLIENIIKVNLSSPLKNLLRYYEAAKNLNFLETGIDGKWRIFGEPAGDVLPVVSGNGLHELWWKHFSTAAQPLNSWTDYYTTIKNSSDESIFGLTAWDEYERISHAANHNLFAAVFQQFLMSFSRLVNAAENELMASIEKQNGHTPHYALFLAFLRLFRLAQDDINTITQRHLDFYYKEILQLKQRPALPNSAHIITELAKPAENFMLPKDTLYKAGKDGEGKDVLYALNYETTFNKAMVTDLRSVYFGTAEDNVTSPPVTNKNRLFAAPVINSADGNGAELTSVNKEWHPFANRIFSNGKIKAVAMPKAEIGFAVASHYLYLQEGKRQVSVKVATTFPGELIGKNYVLYVTTEKKWYKIVNDINVDFGRIEVDEDCVEFSFSLTGDEPAITNYNTAVHGGTLNMNVPVLKIILLNEAGSTYEFGSVTDTNKLRNITVTQIRIEVKVGMDATAPDNVGLKQLQVVTDAGVVDVSKPFMPFGPQPVKDKSFIIGNRELFTKRNASVILNIQWAGITGYTATNVAYPSPTTGFPTVKFDFLSGGKWESDISEFAIFDPTHPETISTAETALYSQTGFDEVYKHYGADSVSGFIRFFLNNSFGHAAYQTQLAMHLIGQSKSTPVSAPPFQNPGAVIPYTPLIQSLTISYSARSVATQMSFNNDDITSGTAEADYNSNEIFLFHIYPFGDAGQHAYLNKQTDQYLFPQFHHYGATGIAIEHQAEFYIGLQNLLPKQSVNILFQVMDGTANPTVNKPGEHIYWSYLSRNQWKNFDKNTISDGTLQLVQSGIIQFVIPADASTGNTIMPGGLLWLRAAVETVPDAVCKLVSVQAQAALVSYKDNENAADFLDKALPATTISKLKIPQSAIKKTTQPYSSFGGRPAEASSAYYMRVSERLRHKARAVTIWDYEHLVLEAFPLIHKVKCLNHTWSEGSKYNEVVPGHVTVITIPNLQQRNDIDPLRPYTSQAVLKSIKLYLEKRISCHVQLHVDNPLFEEVAIKFKLQLAQGYTDFAFYSAKLQEEITAFLSPWAYGKGEITFGGKIYKSVLINFIEERPYVDFILDAEMAHIDAYGHTFNPDNESITPSTAKSILVSAASAKHVIEPAPGSTTEKRYECDYLKQFD